MNELVASVDGCDVREDLKAQSQPRRQVDGLELDGREGDTAGIYQRWDLGTTRAPFQGALGPRRYESRRLGVGWIAVRGLSATSNNSSTIVPE